MALWKVGFQASNPFHWTLGNGTHSHYETPTPVRISIFVLLRRIADIAWPVLVLDWPWVRRRTFIWGIYWALDCCICLSDNECLPLFLDSGPLVGRTSENAFVSSSFSVANVIHNLPSYTLAFAIIVLPITIAPWSSFNDKDESSAATSFSVFVFNLSGVADILFIPERPPSTSPFHTP